MADNTITGLRINQWGVEGVKAVGTLTVAAQPTAGDTLVIGPKTYTFTTDGTANADGEIDVGSDLTDGQGNIVAAINGTDGLNNPNPMATAGAFATNASAITARIPGSGGNSIIFTETFTSVSNTVDGSGVLGGTTSGSGGHGTAVAATSKIAIEQLDWADDDENLYRPKFANGLLIRNRGNATAVQHGTRFSFSDQPMVWEQLMHWLSMAVTGAPTVTLVSGTPNVYRWVFNRAPTANPAPASFTLQRRFDNGTGNTIDQRAAYAMLSEMTLTYAQNEQLKLGAKGFARKFETSAITSALSLPTSQLGVSALSTIYVDDAFANVGDTLLAEQVIGWEFTLGTGIMPLMTAEGRTNLDFTKHQIDAENVTLGLKLTVLLDPTTYATESAAAAAGTRRAVRIQVAGSGGRLLKIDGLFQYTKPSLFKIGTQDGQDMVDIELEEATDNTNFLVVTLEHPSVSTLA